jgi:glycerate kinase
MEVREHLTYCKTTLRLTPLIQTGKDPLFKDVMATYMVSDDTAYIEMSNASGQLLKEKTKLLYTTTLRRVV